MLATHVAHLHIICKLPQYLYLLDCHVGTHSYVVDFMSAGRQLGFIGGRYKLHMAFAPSLRVLAGVAIFPGD